MLQFKQKFMVMIKIYFLQGNPWSIKDS